MEWHFNYNPYHYCFNNPIRFLDPSGLDSISQQEYNNGRPADPEKDHIQIDEVAVSGHRPNWLVRTLHKMGRFFNTSEGTTSEGGLSMSSESAQGTPDKAKHTEDIGNIDALFWMGKGAAAWEHLPKSLSFAEGLHKAVEGSEQIEEMTSDKEIKEATGDKTDANGRDTTIQVVTIKQGPFNKYQYTEEKDTTVKTTEVDKVEELSKKRVQDMQN